MSNILTLTGREWKAFWYSPVAYVVGTFFMIFNGIVFAMLVTALSDPRMDPSIRISQLFFGRTLFFWLAVLMMAPVLTMRTFSEEKRTGTMEVLLSAPVTDWQVIAGKFLGAWLSYLTLWAVTVIDFLILRHYTAFEWMPIVTGYLGTALLGAVLISAGILVSSTTRNQVIAAFVSFVLIVMFFSIGIFAGFFTDPSTMKFIQYLSIIDHFWDFSKGIFDSRPIAFYLSLTASMLFLTTRILGSSRWRA